MKKHLKGAGGLIDNTEGSNRHINIHFLLKRSLNTPSVFGCHRGGLTSLFLSTGCGSLRAVNTILLLSWGT